MGLTEYFMYITVPPSCTARMWMNDVPFFDETAPEDGNWMQQGPANHLLQPGVNEFLIELEHPIGQGGGFFEIAADQRHWDPEFDVRWPALMEELPPDQRKYPLTYRTTFEPQGELFRPVYYDAPRTPVTEEDRLEIRKQVFDIQRAAHSGDGDEFIKLLGFKIAEFRRSLPFVPPSEIDRTVEQTRSMFDNRIESRQVEPDRLRFEERADGRVVHVRPEDGGKLIEVRNADDPSEMILTDLVFSRTADGWRVFR